MLTGVVLGAMRRLPDLLFGEVVARRSESVPCCSECVSQSTVRPDLADDLEWCFWPDWDGDFPDAVVSNPEHLCVIEVKLGASFGPDKGRGPQLQKYWDAGTARASASKKKFWLIALTDDASMPMDEIRNQLQGLDDEDFDRVLWLSWTDVAEHLQALGSQADRTEVDCLLRVLSMADIEGFDGFRRAIELARAWDGTSWRFENDE